MPAKKVVLHNPVNHNLPALFLCLVLFPVFKNFILVHQGNFSLVQIFNFRGPAHLCKIFGHHFFYPYIFSWGGGYFPENWPP
jgi:hypothetical protein